MKLWNKQTNFVFDIPESDCLEFVDKDKDIFKIVDENYTPPEKQEIKTTMFEAVVDESKEEIKEETKIPPIPIDPDVDDFIDNALDSGFDDLSRQELREYCKRNNIKYSVTWSKDKLLENIKGNL